MNFLKAAKGFLGGIIAVIVFAFLVSQWPALSELLQDKKNWQASLQAGENQSATQAIPQKNINAREFVSGAKSAISVWRGEGDSEEILFSQNDGQRMPIASITKLMTALVVWEKFDLSQKITIDADGELVESGRPGCILKEGQSFSVKTLMEIMLVESNSAAAYSLAKSKGEEEFLAMMNAKAGEIGMQNTEFTRTVGRGLSNFSTVKDVALLADYIYINNPQIFEITKNRYYDLYDFDGAFVRKAQSTNSLLSDSSLAPRILGGKTGETLDAGECLALLVKAPDGGRIINVVLNAKDRFLETKKMIFWADSAFFGQEEKFEPDFLDWKKESDSAAWPKRDSHGVIEYNGKLWLMGGLDGTEQMSAPGYVDYPKAVYYSDVWNSEDGINWHQVSKESPWGKRRSFQLASLNGKLWLMGGWSPETGYKNDIWSTKDGINWTLEKESAEWASREGHQVIEFKNRLWLMGGVKYETGELFNDVWSSEDGINWTMATEHAGWSPRWDFFMGIYKGKIWVSSGMIFESKMFNDVWSSEDGINWIMATANAPFEKRQGGILADYKGKLWIIGRLDGINGGSNDLWYSEDGFNWKKSKTDPGWTGREDFGTAMFKNQIWIFGGMDKDWRWRNDIWHSIY